MRLRFLCLVAGLALCSALPWESNSDEHGTYVGKRGTNCKCGWANKDSERIVGGKETRVNEYPHMAVLVKEGIKGSFFPFCGATIISEYWLITAAHCTFDVVFRITVIVGDHDLADDRESKHTARYPVTAINHELYDPKRIVNDIALLQTDRPIRFSQYVGPACLPVGPSPPEGSRVMVTGWGLTTHKGRPSRYLQKVYLHIANLVKCSQAFKYNLIGVYRPTQFCTWALSKDSCQGDSGGPVTWLDPETNRYTLIGLVSFGRDCAGNDPGVNTDVYAFMPWIKSKIGGAKLCQKE